MKEKSCKRTSIGGQAVLEGVMMRGERSMATAVRDQDGIIRVESSRITPIKSRKPVFRFPIIRGVLAFIQSLFGGIKTLMRSAEVYGEGEPSKFEKWVSKKFKIDVMNVVIGISVILGLALAIFLFMFLPQRFRIWIIGDVNVNPWAKNFIEGGFKIVIFTAYILFASLLKDIKRTFMYHGAEHKTIACYENGMELTVENVKKCKRVHDRCGTTFTFFVMFISILVFALFEAVVNVSIHPAVRILCKIALLPLVAGLSYELLKGLAKTSSPIFLPLKAPGLLLQLITTKEPDGAMIEVAIKAFDTVLKMDADETIPETKFVVPKTLEEVLKDVSGKLKEKGVEEESEAEWIVSVPLKIKRSDLEDKKKIISPKNQDKINALLKKRLTGRPLWYCVGDTEFFEYKIKVDERVLIPRPETENLVEEAVKSAPDGGVALDLCTGSGAIAIALKNKANLRVIASDISADALALAEENAKLNNAEIEFVESDLFDNLKGEKFDLIVSNPPYIKSGDIDGLQSEIKNFEPRIALDGGEDGLDFYRRIAKCAPKFLNKNGVILLECGENQPQEIVKLLKHFSDVSVIKDIFGVERIVRAVR